MTVPVNGHPPPLDLGASIRGAGVVLGTCALPHDDARCEYGPADALAVLDSPAWSAAVESIGRSEPCACRLHETIAERGAAALGIGIR